MCGARIWMHHLFIFRMDSLSEYFRYYKVKCSHGCSLMSCVWIIYSVRSPLSYIAVVLFFISSFPWPKHGVTSIYRAADKSPFVRIAIAEIQFTIRVFSIFRALLLFFCWLKSQCSSSSDVNERRVSGRKKDLPILNCITLYLYLYCRK